MRPHPDQAVEALDPREAAKLARLHHHNFDDRPGITRRKASSGFDYRRPDGSLVRDVTTLRRIQSIVIPPAWSDVWINPDPLRHIQATGRDQRGRSNTAIIPGGARSGTNPNTTRCSSSPECCR
jgi:DNA topoisomerase I